MGYAAFCVSPSSEKLLAWSSPRSVSLRKRLAQLRASDEHFMCGFEEESVYTAGC